MHTIGEVAIQKIRSLSRRQAEKALLVGAGLKRKGDDAWSMEDSLQELALLARTAGLQVVGVISQSLQVINPATYIGKGKLEEIKEFALYEPHDVVIFDMELLPTQQRNLENALEARVLDRTTLILDIFASHARTREGVLQVELAQYEYRLPRLTRHWTHLSRQGVGGVGLRGPGETQLETDRRIIGRRIAAIRRQLEVVRAQRQQHRRRRRESAVPTVAIVGYTNAGKSTLINTLADADVLVEDKLFATLDPTTRRVPLPGGKEVLFTDTVGFIQKLPATLVAAFRATLEEIKEADLLLHVVDITSPHVLGQHRAVMDTLGEIGAGDVPMVTTLNKIDLLTFPEPVNELIRGLPNSVGISALTGQGIDLLLARVEEALKGQMIDVVVRIPFAAGDVIALFHRFGSIESQEQLADSVQIHGQMPVDLVGRIEPFMQNE